MAAEMAALNRRSERRQSVAEKKSRASQARASRRQSLAKSMSSLKKVFKTDKTRKELCRVQSEISVKELPLIISPEAAAVLKHADIEDGWFWGDKLGTVPRQRHGPMSSGDLIQARIDGWIDEETLIWAEPMEQWHKFGEVFARRPAIIRRVSHKVYKETLGFFGRLFPTLRAEHTYATLPSFTLAAPMRSPLLEAQCLSLSFFLLCGSHAPPTAPVPRRASRLSSLVGVRS